MLSRENLSYRNVNVFKWLLLTVDAQYEVATNRSCIVNHLAIRRQLETAYKLPKTIETVQISGV